MPYCYHDGQLLTGVRAGQHLPPCPRETAWQSDLEALRLLAQGQSPVTLESVAAKYLANTRCEPS